MFTRFNGTANALKFCLANILCCSVSFVSSQTNFVSEPGNKAPGDWKTFLVKDVNGLKIPPPPNAEQTQKELKDLKEKLAQRNSQKTQSILYWDAGSPAYRWNQL